MSGTRTFSSPSRSASRTAARLSATRVADLYFSRRFSATPGSIGTILRSAQLLRTTQGSDWREAAAEQAELVALRVGEHVPGLLAGLSDVGRHRARRQQPLQLGVLVAVGGVDVDVQ